MKTPLAGALLCASLLAGCGGQIPLTSPNSSPIDAAVGNANAVATSAFPSLASIEAKISAATVKGCKWVPDVSIVGDLAATISGNGTASAVTAAVTGLAKAVCTLLTAPASNGVGLLDRAAVPTYRGVPLIGTFKQR